MCEGAAAVAVAESPDVWRSRSQLIVHLNVASCITLNGRIFESQIIRVGSPSGRNEYMRPDDYGIALFTRRSNLDAARRLTQRDAFGFEAECDAFAGQD